MNGMHGRLMLAAPASGSGKTTLTMGLLQILLDRGFRPAAFKCGPDYIDPMFHREVLGVPGRNLDLFFTPPDIVRGLFRHGAATADFAVLEGVMGHYDGVGATSRASGWHMAAETNTPAILVVRPHGAFLSLAALVKGFVQFRDDSRLRGIVLNQCGTRLCDRLAPVLERETGLKVFGCVPTMPEAALESRHLGLATPDSVAELQRKIRFLADGMAATLDVDGLIRLAETAPDMSAALPIIRPVDNGPARIAVARDRAFCFYYQENLDLLRSFGAELVAFSPMRDKALPDDIGGLYLGGGYPELFAEELGRNVSMRQSVKTAVESGLPTVAECGGFLYLQAQLEGADGTRHPMAGVFEGTGYNAGRLGRFGYMSLRAERDTLLCRQDEEILAHEFHYWDSVNAGDAYTAEKAGGGESWKCVMANENLYAGFPHLYFWSNPDMARRFVAASAGRDRKGGA